MVAIKILIGEYAHKPDLVERFLYEAKASARIRHEHVVDVTDFGKTPDGNVFFCMELMEGVELADELRSNGRLSWARAKGIVLQIAAGLAAAHQVGVVHRDLKPENVFLVHRHGSSDYVKVLDFGIAKLTEVDETRSGSRKLTKTGMIFGTPDYMAPEQARGEDTDARVDVYALGCILYELLAGKPPYQADTFMAVLTKQLFDPVPRLTETNELDDVPAGLDAVLERAMAKNAEDRYPDMNSFARAIDELDDISGVMYMQPGATVQVPVTAVARGKAPLAIACAVLLMGAAGAWVMFGNQADPVIESPVAAPQPAPTPEPAAVVEPEPEPAVEPEPEPTVEPEPDPVNVPGPAPGARKPVPTRTPKPPAKRPSELKNPFE